MYSISTKEGMTEEKDLNSVVITIAGRTFPVKLDNDEKDFVVELEHKINAQVMEFQKTYPNRDKLDCVIMTLLMYSFESKKQIPVDVQNQIHLKANQILQAFAEFDAD